MQHQRVAVGVLEEGHVADAGVERVAAELHAARLQLGACLRDVRHVQRERMGARGVLRGAGGVGVEQLNGDGARLELAAAVARI